MNDQTPIVIHTTLPDLASASSIAVMLVEKHLVACVQVIPGLTSYYYWHNHLNSSPEYLLQIKTVSKFYEGVRVAILEMHPYDVPEIIAFEVKHANQEFLDWMKEVMPEA